MNPGHFHLTTCFKIVGYKTIKLIKKCRAYTVYRWMPFLDYRMNNDMEYGNTRRKVFYKKESFCVDPAVNHEIEVHSDSTKYRINLLSLVSRMFVVKALNPDRAWGNLVIIWNSLGQAVIRDNVGFFNHSLCYLTLPQHGVCEFGKVNPSYLYFSLGLIQYFQIKLFNMVFVNLVRLG